MKKTFRFIALLLVLAMLSSSLASCTVFLGDDDANDPTTVTGKTEGSVYKNEFFDLSLSLPAHWVFEDKNNLSDNPYFFFSKMTDEEKQNREFSLEPMQLRSA